MRLALLRVAFTLLWWSGTEPPVCPGMPVLPVLSLAHGHSEFCLCCAVICPMRFPRLLNVTLASDFRAQSLSVHICEVGAK